MKVGGFVERVEEGKKVPTRFGLEDNLPAIAGIGALMEGRHWWSNDELLDAVLVGRLNNFSVQFSDVLDGRFFSFVRQRKFEQKTIGREGTLFALLKQVFIKVCVIAGRGIGNYGVIWLKTLYKDFAVLMTTFSAADYLSD